MESLLVPGVVYTDISPDITETDIDVESDLWMMDGREVYRGTRDPRYTHANVYWLYDEDLQRVGCAEHALDAPGDMRLLWFHESPFATLLQEDGWVIEGDVWSRIPTAPFERFLNEGWTTVESILEQCLAGPVRLVTPSMLLNTPIVYTCTTCGRKSLRTHPHCTMVAGRLDFPQLEKVLCVDEELLLHRPPQGSVVFTRLTQPGGGGSSQPPPPQPELEPEQEAPSVSPRPPQTPAETQQQEPAQTSPPQSHLRTPEPPSGAEEAQPERA
jgi:hypothetical protein